MKRTRTGKQTGQALVELAIVLPFLLLLTLGVVELGRYAYIAILIGNAAHAGAFYGAQGNGFATDSAGIANAADYDFAGATSGATNDNGQTVSKLTVTSAVSCGCDAAGTITTYGCTTQTNANAGSCPSGSWVVMVSVTATGSFNSLFSYPGIPSPLVVTRTATIRVA